MKPKVSIITACFNSEKTISSSVESVLSQTYPGIEYLVIDGGSTDQTLSCLAPHRTRIARIVSEKDQGIYAALNKGIALSSGEVVGFLHSDDRFAHPRAIEHLVEKMLLDEADGVYSDLEYVRSSRHSEGARHPEGALAFGSSAPQAVLRYWKSEPFRPALLSRGWMPPHPTLYLKRAVYEQVGVFDLRYSIAADYDFVLRAFREPRLRWSYLSEVTVQMNTGGISNRSLGQIIRKSREDFAILSNHGLSPWIGLALKNLSKIPQLTRRAGT